MTPREAEILDWMAKKNDWTSITELSVVFLSDLGGTKKRLSNLRKEGLVIEKKGLWRVNDE